MVCALAHMEVLREFAQACPGATMDVNGEGSTSCKGLVSGMRVDDARSGVIALSKCTCIVCVCVLCVDVQVRARTHVLGLRCDIWCAVCPRDRGGMCVGVLVFALVRCVAGWRKREGRTLAVAPSAVRKPPVGATC